MADFGDSWLDQMATDERLGWWRLEVSSGAMTLQGALWSTVEAPTALGDWGRTIHEEDRATWLASVTALIEGRIERQQVLFRPRSVTGPVRWFESRSAVVHRDPTTGRATRVQGTVIECTTWVGAKQDHEVLVGRLRQAQKMQGIGTLAGGLAHDFNNVLATIWAEADLGQAAASQGDEAELRESFSLIQKSVERGAALTRSFLGYARRQSGPRRVVQVDLLIHEVWPMLRRLISASVSFKLKASQAVWVMVDPALLEQMLVTLIITASEAVKGQTHGEITVNCEAVEVGQTVVQARPWVKQRAFVQLTVHDTGAGIDPRVRERLADPAFSGDEAGPGLSTVYAIVKEHDGFVEAHTEPGRGSRIEVYWPRVSPLAE